jgi:RNA polymerase sigma-70 factor (ECF subfamily)
MTGTPDQAAVFEEFLAPVEKKLYNFVRKASGFSQECGDLFQDVVLRAFKYFSSFDRKRSFSAWIFAIAHNEIKKFYQSRKESEAVASLSDLPVDPPAAASNPDIEVVYAVARRLPPKEREVFFLYYDDDFSVAEIASITGLSSGYVKFILHEARQSIKQILEVPHGTR